MEKYILTAEEIAALKGVNKAHFLNDKARRYTKSLGDETGLTGMGFHLVEVEPGGDSVEYHVHFHEDECVYILEGRGETTIGDRVYTVAKGDFIGYRAGGLPHKLKNTGDSILKYIVVGQRLDHDVVDYPAQNKRLFRNKGLNWDLVDKTNIEEPLAGKKK